MKIKTVIAQAGVGLAVLLWSANALGADGDAQKLGALQVFDRAALAAAPLWVQIWLPFMMATFLVGLIFFAWKKPIARWAAGGFLFALATGHLVFGALGLPMLSGSIAIWHLVCWSPALVMLLVQRPFLDANEGRWFRIWSAVVTAVIIFSFVFDIRDAWIYIEHFSR